jgi:NADPH:quinone reductase-like Zn-dependent oxidoreductase
MKAAVCTAYGPPETVVLRDVPEPTPGDDEVLIRVHATTVSSGDARLRAARFPSGFAIPARLAFGIGKPRNPILGAEFAGVVAATGRSVTAWKAGDAVFAATGMRMGGHAEFRVMPEAGAMAPVPAGFDLDEAAAIAFGGGAALHFLAGAGRLKPGERLLVVGACGAVGGAAVQIGKSLGAHVTGVCSAANAPLARSLGADAVIDYRTQDFAGLGERWDVILDTVGDASLAGCRSALNASGRLLLAVASLGQMLAAPLQSLQGGLAVSAGPAPDGADILRRLAALCAAGAFRPAIDSRFAFEDIVEAHRRVDTGRKTGSVLVRIHD